MRAMLFAVCMFGCTTVVSAGNATGSVSILYVATDSATVLFQLDAPIKDTPRCNESGRFAVNTGKPGGMVLYMALLEAKREKYQISVAGLNTCTSEWRSEDVKNISVR